MTTSATVRAADGARPEFQLIGTMGDRIVLFRLLWSGGPADGRFEIEYYVVTEVDESGRVSAFVLYDLEDAEQARREALTRWRNIDPTAEAWVDLVTVSAAALNDGDIDRLRGHWAEDLVVEDRRRTGFGQLEGIDSYLESLRVLWDLAPDQQLALGTHWPAYDRHVAVLTVRRSGRLAEGGEFESDCLVLLVMPERFVTRLEIFELEDLDKALARLEELRTGSGKAG